EHNVPTWGQLGESHTRRGALLSISEADRTDSSAFTASVFDRILRGVAPGEINQIYEDPKTLVINAETARRIGFTIPPGLFSVADKVFQEIEGESENTRKMP
ncbi:MAG: hypothetical protein ACOCVL_03310, partial [Candidatus Sumerlaeota bacterium]